MAVTEWLIDKSAFTRLPGCPDLAEWRLRTERGLIRITSSTLLELGYSSRNVDELRTTWEHPPISLMPIEYLTPVVEDRAREVLSLLAVQGQHRAPSIPDLLIAAAAEMGQLTVLHLDNDFELIAEVTGQPVERLRLDPPPDI